MPPTSQSEIRMLLFPFKLRDSAARAFVTKQHGCARTWRHMERKLEEKDPTNAVGTPFIYFLFIYFFHFKIPGRNHLPVKSNSDTDFGEYIQIRAKVYY